MLRAFENLRDRPGFDDLAVLENGDVVAEHADHGQIVADEHQRKSEPFPQLPDQQQNVGLVETSSPETISSATMKSGSSASARAIPARCRWPPESSWDSGR